MVLLALFHDEVGAFVDRRQTQWLSVHRTPGELPSHGRDKFHGKKDSCHARVEVWIDEPGTDYVIRKTVINSVRLGIQPWLHVLYCSDFNDSLIFD